LGQHFLENGTVLEEIAASLEIEPKDTVIEIGPGHGELTKYILSANPSKLIVIERDPELASKLRETLSDKLSDTKLEIIEDDVLKTLPSLIRNLKLGIRNSNYKVVGNIPYYITGYLLRILGELEHKPKLIVLTIQKEVAERVCATPPKMNLLAASVQFWAEPKIEAVIKSGAFSPPPEVDSAVLKLKPVKIKDIDPETYYKLIKILFKQPRKTILNNLRSGLDKSNSEIETELKSIGIDPTDRPQNLDIDEIKYLSSKIFSKTE